ncbi:MAG: fibronectin type III domain-containing protein [Planctomycetes bacterium]|nr:fibronectin type III domain-containing protein [Planctomycetota bacterium]
MSRTKGLLSVCFGGMLVGCLALGCAGGGDDGVDDGIPDTDALYSVSLTWDPPSLNEDNSPVGDLGGYRIYVGSEPGVYSRVEDVGNLNVATVGSLPEGTRYFAVTAYDLDGNESSFSGELSVQIPDDLAL